MRRRPPRSTLFPYTTLADLHASSASGPGSFSFFDPGRRDDWPASDRKSTRLNSSHVAISYAVSCLKKKSRLDLVERDRLADRHELEQVARLERRALVHQHAEALVEVGGSVCDCLAQRVLFFHGYGDHRDVDSFRPLRPSD